MKSVEELGPEIWRLRKERKLSQREAAGRVGVCQSTWGAWENGQAIPTVRNLHKITEVIPLELAKWKPAVVEYHQRWPHAARGGNTPTRGEYGEVVAMIRDKPRRRELKTKRSSIGEIARAARAEGMTYGEYIARHGL